MNSTLLVALLGFNIGALFINILLVMCLVVDRNELLKQWRAWMKEKDHE